ncbi:(S)-benzoin forming benzil reductase [Oceanobacillus alkalisoli]|uniref:(S)-benzoin forming benzil reductase n=1 Tax=Oceanobacillus alkalisoli TaxID=2925113 RepID=UPI001EE4DD9F|nr:(S)-benzoin forming benzil reductase [Oceanobacillus alkalisoli]MCG5102037.1 (S)-benzoin forming benzil reductase [Oceanobacillus alkalisoli]
MAKLAVITGVSRGLGASLAKFLLESGMDVIGISRTENKHLTTAAKENNQFYRHVASDLADIPQLEEAVEIIHEEIKEKNAEKEIETIFLLNNAGVVHPIDQSQHIKTEALVSHVTINSIAPMVLTNQFLKKHEEHQIPLVIANVSSGAAESPIYGWSAYCSTKASLNMYTKTVALEQEELKTDNRIIAFSPGVMDTDMQTEIRSSTKDQFVEIDKFKDYKVNNSLRQTDLVAGVLIDIITDEDVKNGKIYYISDYI